MPKAAQPEAWLRYVSHHIDGNGDQEALVYLRSRGEACKPQTDEIVRRWRVAERRSLEAGSGGFSSFDAATGEHTETPGTPIEQGRDIRRISRFELRDFWWGYDHQEFTIDATMLRTVEACGIGGFDEWWERLAIEAREGFLHGGVSPIPASYWLFAMCRSDYGRRLLGNTLVHVLEAIEVPTGDERYQWHVAEPGPVPNPPIRIVAHMGCAAAVMFANRFLAADRVTSETLSAASRDVLRSQDQTLGSWSTYAGIERPSIETTAMAIHGLAVTKPDGWQRAAHRGAKWLKSMQKDAHWTEPGMPDPVYLTVLVLDAMVLAAGYDQPLTFHVSDRHGESRKVGNRNRRFRAALSFPGEVRHLVGKLAGILARAYGKDAIFYDEYFRSELARPNLDLYLQSIYAEHSDLVVVFLCEDYERKEWCGLEWRAVRELIKRKQSDRVMFLRVDDVSPAGVFSIDGFIDCRRHSPAELARFIAERIDSANEQGGSSRSRDRKARS